LTDGLVPAELLDRTALPFLDRRSRRRFDGDVERWYDRKGNLHRAGAPSSLHPQGQIEFHHYGVRRGAIWGEASAWYDQRGLRHRDDGLPALTDFDGNRFWIDHGRLHNPDGPSIIRVDGTCEWHMFGLRHRQDGGPTIIEPNGIEHYHHLGISMKVVMPG
jgi:hypothetical protein